MPVSDDAEGAGPITGPLAQANRRRFLTRSAAAAGVLALDGLHGAAAADRAASAGAAAWTHEQGKPILSPPYGLPSPHEADVVRRPTDLTPTPLSSWSFTPLQDLDGIITPNGLFFERHHAGVPAISPDAHRLVIHGMVDRPLMLSMDDILRLPSVSRIHFLECSGNTLTEWKGPKEKTVQGTHGLLSCAEWTGVPLSVLAEQVGLRPGVKWMLAEGADAAVMDRSIPIAKVLDDALLVYSQNGERLRPEQGYPLRLLLPGYEGNMNIKWLRRLKFSDQPFYTREETSKYSDLMPDGKARLFTFDMEAKSVITSPSGGMRIGAPGFREIRGLAWSGRGRISRVDVSVDGGRNWQQARLQSPVLPKCLTRFRMMWNWQGGPAILQSRCIDETGYVQPTLAELVAVRGLNSVYHLNAIQSWGVAQNGEVTNVHA
ncbi:sulfite dehydrogenase [Noviherbaspirillum suwonense]|jgi:sulfane dehydrogenase subunit SoxC|uniref:Sulfane dehydrogenase subunit SoxC n=1 Tax=Noviherbaspirillum suwonense TaxID=1224511 RepID=A0ABY1QP44_9BURK|nr:sulfite dehydrogenase [Noviherbaspirillum suwonense]SMP76841.1 sulfane dehydrogenase subunit SoxC [Noviherbaspirillum suwonense]